jgi:hypothetical protein
MAKTKIFWIAKKVDDTMQMWGYNNKRKAEEKGLELFGVGITDFSFNLDGEEFEDENGFTAYISSGQIDSFGHFLLYRADGMPHAIGLEQERAATEYVEAELPSSAGACFPAKLKGGSCDVYMSSAVEANGALWTFEDGDIYEKTKTTMRHIPTFESFINEARAVKNTKSEKIIFDSPADMAKGIIDYFKQYDYTLEDKYDENWYSDLIKKNFIPTNKNTSTNMDHQLNLTDENGKKVKGAFGLVNLYVDRDSEKLAVIISIGKP